MATLTELERNAPGGQSLIDGGFRSAMPPQVPAPTPTPQVVVPGSGPVPDLTESLADTYQRGLDVLNQDPAGIRGTGGEATIGEELNTFNAPDTTLGPSYDDIYGEEIDEDAVYRRTLSQFQSQIDATNQAYDFLRNEAVLEGQGRLGSQRAQGARGGILGSDFASSQKEKVQDFNTAEQRQIAAERMAAIAGIENQARGLAQSIISGKRTARQQGAENYISYLNNEATLKEQNTVKLAQALLAQGFTPGEMDEDEINRIAEAAGTTAADITTAFYGLQQEQEGVGGNDFGFMSTSGGIFRTDPATGEAKFIPSGGGTPSDGGDSKDDGSTETEGSGFDTGRNIISNNPSLNDDQIKAELLEKTDLSVTEINSLISTRENRELSNFNDQVSSQIVNALFSESGQDLDYNDAKEYIEAGVITSKGKKYNLTNEQKEQLLTKLNEQRGFFQKLIPGGK